MVSSRGRVISPNQRMFSVCGGAQRRTVRYDRNTRRLEVLDESGKQIGRCRPGIDETDIGSDPIRMECYLDHSMFEVYLNGRKSATVRNYFENPRYFAVEGDFDCVKLWDMDTAYPED